MPNLQQALQQAQQELVSSGSAKLDAEVLLATILNKQRTFLRAFPETELTAEQYTTFLQWVARRQTGEPIAYIVQTKEFWSLPLKVTADVLVPRAETECLVEAALALLPKEASYTVADLGTGSGAIGLALASERPHCHIIATDVSDAALQVAQANAEALAIKNIRFIESDWGSALAESAFHMVVSNPPYIDVLDKNIEPAVQKFQPKLALFADSNGLAAIKIIVLQAQYLLKADGYLLLEHGFCQQADVVRILTENNFLVVEQGKDLSSLPRFVIAHKKSLK